MSLKNLSTLLVLVGICWFASLAQCADKLVVHEWGTFTSLQDESGKAIGGINTDDEPVPKFVHNIADGLLISRTELPSNFFQGTPSCHPDVTLRLETPVLYFHADKNFRGRVDVRVEFKGGWLTQFYPDAAAVAPGVQTNWFGGLSKNTVSSLTWNNLELNAASSGPHTTDAVWTAPRRVDALQVKTEKGESERYLFYRGVGNFDAPLKVARDAAGTMRIAENDSSKAPGIKMLWYADIRKDGTGAYRAIRADENAAVLATTPAEFASAEYKRDAVPALRLEMRAALIAAGLFADEADALLNTWEVSYFKSFGARLFFLVPAEWTERVMPLSISGHSCAITRVMVGRVELVSPEQRALLKKIATSKTPASYEDFRKPMEAQLLHDANGNWNKLFSGEITLDQAGFKAPELWRTYLDLGRFRNALVLDEVKRQPTPELKAFIDQFNLKGYDPKD